MYGCGDHHHSSVCGPPPAAPPAAATLLSMMIRLAIAAAIVTGVSAHASMTKPFPRNARDGNLTIFKNGAWPTQGRSAQVGNSGCSCANSEGCAAGLGRPETNGQPCLWFSQGCSPGCKTCTGANGHTNRPLCATFTPPTNNKSEHRTEDPTDPASFLYTPWRSPGHAPTADPCGREIFCFLPALLPHASPHVRSTHLHSPPHPTNSGWRDEPKTPGTRGGGFHPERGGKARRQREYVPEARAARRNMAEGHLARGSLGHSIQSRRRL